MNELIEDLKKVITLNDSNKDIIMKILIREFLEKRDKELLTIQGVEKSLKDGKVPSFQQWKQSNYIHYDKNLYVRKNEGLKNIDDLRKIYEKIFSL